MQETEKSNKQFHIFRPLYLILGILALFIIAYCILRYNLQSKIEAKLDEIRSQGYPADCYELDKWYSIPPDAENAADYYLKAFAYYSRPDDEKYKSLPLFSREKLSEPNKPLTEQTKQLIAEYLFENKESLDLLHKAAKIKNCRYPVDLTKGFNTLLPHLSDVRVASRLLCLEAVHYDEINKPDKAIDSIESAFSAANSLSKEPMVISFLVCQASKKDVIQTLERILKRNRFTSVQLERLQKILSELENTSSIKIALAGERCLALDITKIPISKLKNYFRMSSSVPFMASNTVFLFIYRLSGIEDMDVSLYLDLMSDYIRACELPLHQRQKAFIKIDEQGSEVPKYYVISKDIRFPISRIASMDIEMTAKLRVIKTSIAVERYRLKQGQLPENLSALVPDFIDSIPNDPFDGNDLRYKKLDTGFVVSSIGEDLIDNIGGQKTIDMKACGDDIFFSFGE